MPAELSTLHRKHPFDFTQACTERSRSGRPHLRVLCLFFTWTPDQALEALQSGAIGSLSASITADDLAAALRQAARGEVTLSPDLTRDLILSLSFLQA